MYQNAQNQSPKDPGAPWLPADGPGEFGPRSGRAATVVNIFQPSPCLNKVVWPGQTPKLQFDDLYPPLKQLCGLSSHKVHDFLLDMETRWNQGSKVF